VDLEQYRYHIYNKVYPLLHFLMGIVNVKLAP